MIICFRIAFADLISGQIGIRRPFEALGVPLTFISDSKMETLPELCTYSREQETTESAS